VEVREVQGRAELGLGRNKHRKRIYRREVASE